jgi:hypothetical protein
MSNRGTSCPIAASCSNTSTSVEGPVFVFLSIGSCSLVNRIVRSCGVELRLNPCPGFVEAPFDRGQLHSERGDIPEPRLSTSTPPIRLPALIQHFD